MVTGISKIAPRITKQIKVRTNLFKRGIRNTKNYYTANIKRGWNNGKEVAKKENLSSFRTFFKKLGGSLKETKVRGKDLPLLTYIVSRCTIPLPFVPLILAGIAKVGVVAGKYVKKLPNLLKGVRH